MATALSDAEMAVLTDEERLAMSDPAGDPETPPAEPAPAEPAPPAPPPAETPPAEPVTEPAEPQAAAPASAIPDWEMPADVKAQLAGNDAERRALAKKYDEGELTGLEFSDGLTAINDARTAIQLAAERAQMGEDMRVKHWTNVEVRNWLALPEHAAYKDPVLYKQLDDMVQDAQEQAIAQGLDHLDPQILENCHAEIVRASRLLAGMPAPATPITARAPPPPTAQRPPTPPTLAKVPAADMNVEGGDVSDLEALDRMAKENPVEFEDVVYPRLPNATREAFLKYQATAADTRH